MPAGATVPDAVFDAETLGLIVVDVQKGFLSPDAVPVRKGLDTSMPNERLPRIRELLSVCREAGLTVAHTRSVRRADGADAPRELYDVVPSVYEDGPPSCCAGTVDVAYADGVEPRADEFEVTKKRYDPFRGTSLAWDLRSQGVETVLVCGFMTDVCVASTARSAHEEGFNVIVVADCCAAASEEAHAGALRTFERVLGATMQFEEVRTRLARSHARTT